MRLLTVIIVIASLFVSTSQIKAEETVKVGAIFAKTGKAAMDSELVLSGIRFAIEDLNEQGGVLGKQLKLIEFDNRGTPIGAKIAAEKAVKAGVITVFGSNWSSHSLAMAPTLQAAGIPMISPISTNPAVTRVGNYIFRICYIDPFQGRVLADFAVNDLKAKTAGVLVNVDDKYSEGLADFFIDSYRQKGGHILFIENYLEKTSDFSSFFEKSKKYKPDVLFHPGHTKVSAFVLKQAREEGINTIFIGGDGWNDSMYKIAGSHIEGNYYSNHWHQDSSNQKSRQFVKKLKNRLLKFNPETALSNDCVFLFADAVRRASSFEPARIRDAIASTKGFQGVTGDISFNENGDPIKSAVILKFDNGTSVYVKTVEP